MPQRNVIVVVATSTGAHDGAWRMAVNVTRGWRITPHMRAASELKIALLIR